MAVSVAHGRPYAEGDPNGLAEPTGPEPTSSGVEGYRAMTHTDTLMNRRSFGRMMGLGAAVAVVPTFAFVPRDVGASRVWCRADPLFLVGTKVIDVTVGSQFEMFATATGPVKIKLTTPVGVSVTQLVSDFGFGDGYSITYATDKALEGGSPAPEVRVEVLAPSAADLPVSIFFTRIGALGKVELRSIETQGRSNAWVAAR